jgi:hypothetical protein
MKGQWYANRLTVALHCPVIQSESVERRIANKGMVSLLIVERYVIGFVFLPFCAFISIEKRKKERVMKK